MKQLYTAFICLYFVMPAVAQKRTRINAGEPGITTHLVSYAHRGVADSLITGWRISTNLITLLSPDGGLSLAAEYRPTASWGIVLEGGWIFIDEKKVYDMRGEFTPKAAGFYVRPEIRYYLPGKYKKYRWFFGHEFSYKKVNFLEERIVRVGVDPDGDYFDYEQLSAYEKAKELYGTSGKVGLQFFADKKHHILFEVYIGLGVKYRVFSYKQQPPAGSYLEDRNYSFDNLPDKNHLWDISMPIGMKIGYRF
jgi:hypothetical protein